MPHEMIITERHGRVGVINFNRPDRRVFHERRD